MPILLTLGPRDTGTSSTMAASNAICVLVSADCMKVNAHFASCGLDEEKRLS
jgi:hypothetical protein